MLKDRWRSILALMGGNGQAKAFSVKNLLDLIHLRDGLLVITLVILGVFLGYISQGVFGSVEQDQVKQENRLLREQNQLYQDQLDELKKRVNTIEDLSKELSRAAGKDLPATVNGTGGPEAASEWGVIAGLKESTSLLEFQLRDLKLDFDRERLEQAAIPLGLPVEGLITDRFGGRPNPFGEGYEYHTGLDISTSFGTPVKATADGLVIYAAAHSGYGNVVVIDHGNNITTRYGHLSSVSARFGERIKRGEVVGRAGSTGRSTGNHVHYEVRKDNQPLNPLNYLDRSLSN